MGWRRFVNELLLISPLVFLACITVQARTRVDGFARMEYSSSLNLKIAAYIEPVKAVEECLAKGMGSPSPRELRRAGEVWREGTQRDILKPLLPEVPGDSTRDGIKAQICVAAGELCSHLQRLARQEFASKNFAQAANDALLSIEALQAVKYSDLYSMGILSTKQNGALELLAQCISELTPSQKVTLAKRIQAVKESERPLGDLVLAAQRTLSSKELDLTWTRSYRNQLELMLTMARQIDEDRTKHQLSEFPRQFNEFGGGMTVSEIFPSIRFVWNARRNGNHHWQEIESKLGTAL